MKSNKHTLPVWTQLKAFHDLAEHTLKINFDDKIVYEKTLEPNVVHHIKLNEHFDFSTSGRKTIKIDCVFLFNCPIVYTLAVVFTISFSFKILSIISLVLILLRYGWNQ